MKSTMRIAIAAACGLVLSALADGVQAGRVVTVLGSSDVTGVSPLAEGLGDFYVIQFTPPADLTPGKLEEAFLEFYVDASSAIDAELLPAPARIEVFLLSRELAGDVTAGDIVAHTRMTRSVLRGTNRFVRLNVTRAIREVLRKPASNYGLVVGSLTGGRDSLFELKRKRFPGGGDARLVYSTVN